MVVAGLWCVDLPGFLEIDLSLECLLIALVLILSELTVRVVLGYRHR